jgi:hypothetical protein
VTWVLAHGLVGRQDLPVPAWLFGWAAAVALIASFVALGALWPKPRLAASGFRPLPGALGRALGSRALERVAGAIGVALLALVIYSGLAGSEETRLNFAPTFVYVHFWVGLVFASALFGDVFRAFNPWRAVGLAVGWVVGRLARGGAPEPLPYPERLGHWPAAIGILGFAWLELALATGDEPDTVALATIAYSALTFIGMALYGVDRWTERGEAFSVYFGLFARLSAVERRDGVVGLRMPLSGLARLEPLPGTVALLAVMIGSTSFDGASEGNLWGDAAPRLVDVFTSLGLGPASALEAAFTLGLVGSVLAVAALYALGVTGARAMAGGSDLARSFAASLVPIAAAYVAAHYFTLLLYEGQAISWLAADPLGRDEGLSRTPDYGVIGATAAWYWQVGFVVLGHVAALMLAHDRALELYRDARKAVRSQAWMLGVMVAFTTLALWLLSEASR